MPRIQGVDVPNGKPTYIALTYLFGIGRTTAIEICFTLGIDPQHKSNDLTEDEIARINSIRSGEQSHRMVVQQLPMGFRTSRD